MIHAVHPDLPPFEVSLDNVAEFARVVSKARGVETPAYFCLLLYGICPAGYFTAFSYEAARIYSACGGTSRMSSPDAFYNLASAYLDICGVIDAKIEEVRKRKAAAAENQQAR